MQIRIPSAVPRPHGPPEDTYAFVARERAYRDADYRAGCRVAIRDAADEVGVVVIARATGLPAAVILDLGNRTEHCRMPTEVLAAVATAAVNAAWGHPDGDDG